jgi:transposase-like protein
LPRRPRGPRTSRKHAAAAAARWTARRITPYLFVDAKIEKVRDGGRVQRKAVVVAHAVHETGRREIIGRGVRGQSR